ncbi:MAG: hypothetical protein WBY44_00125 [Bryobacteraceae bacterium]
MRTKAQIQPLAYTLVFATLSLVALDVARAQTTGVSSTSPQGWLISGNFIGPSDLASDMTSVLQKMGGRMMSAATAQVVLTGTTTDVNGSRAAQIIVQAPGYLSYREGATRALTFSGSAFQSAGGQLTSGDQQVLESFLAHFPDTILLQQCTGGSLRRIPGHFRNDASRGANYTGPYWRIFEFSPSNRQGLARGQALQQELFVAVDEGTWLISEVRVVTKTQPNAISVTQTQFANWVQQNGQWYPGQIVRLENGKQVLSFKTTQGAVGIASAIAAFIP